MTKLVRLRFYAELNDFLSPERRQVTMEHRFTNRPSLKDLIESVGIPHTEVDLILVNGESRDFSYIVQDGDQISVYPIFESIDITPLQHLRPRPLRVIRFVLDVHLGKLASYLRMLGFDARYQNDFADDKLARLSQDEKRILLTKDRGLLKRNAVTHGYYVRANGPRSQLVEVLKRFDLFNMVTPFRRCMRCNGLLESVDKSSVLDRLPPKTQQHYDEFQRCQDCGQVYWKGPHYQRMLRLIDEILESEVGR